MTERGKQARQRLGCCSATSPNKYRLLRSKNADADNDGAHIAVVSWVGERGCALDK